MKDKKIDEEVLVLAQHLFHITNKAQMLSDFIDEGNNDIFRGKYLAKTLLNSLGDFTDTMMYYWDQRGLIPDEINQKFEELIRESNERAGFKEV